MFKGFSNQDHVYDVAITGGGLAGLALAIQLVRQGRTVVLFEKEAYPFHRVCGEYISRESWNFLISLGLDLPGLQVPVITQLQVSSPSGKKLDQQLPLGGFGISRFLLDESLCRIAKSSGAEVLENTKVIDLSQNGNHFITTTAAGSYKSRTACGSFGKRSNLDINWQRPFIRHLKTSLNNYIGVKYHVRGNFAADTVFLHLFKNGYAGLVKIEGDLYNFCYLSSESNLKACGNSIEQLEKQVLARNPVISDLLSNAVRVDDKPVTISQISFESKDRVENHVLMLGDAAGMITPLCGNGMSIALHSSKIAASLINDFLAGAKTQHELELAWSDSWKREFGNRLKAGRMIQRCLSRPGLAAMMIRAGQLAPSLLKLLIRRTHGKPF